MLKSILIIIISCLSLVNAVHFEILSKETKCLYDELNKHVLATGSYNIMKEENDLLSRNEKGHLQMKVVVKDPKHKEIFSSHGIIPEGPIGEHHNSFKSSKFAFVSNLQGKYEVCFTNEDSISHIIAFKLKSGVEAKDLTEVAQHEHLKPLAIELLRLESIVNEIHKEMLKMKEWEAEMRNMNEVTNSRVKYFSLFSVLIVLTLGVWQAYHLRSYLITKKLL